MDDIPFDELKELIESNYESSSSYLNPTQSFHQAIESTFSLISDAIKDNNSTLCQNLLNHLLLQLQSFANTELSWLGTTQYKDLIQRHDLYARKEWELHTLPSLPHGSMFDGKGVVYTAITGEYDNLTKPLYINPSWKYICFTNNKSISSDIWEIRYLENDAKLDNIRLARRCKILCTEYLPDYDYSIWCDGKIQIKSDLYDIIKLYHLSSPMLCMPHYERNCIYEEANACIEAKKGNEKEILNQISRYRSENYPEHNGLVDSCVLFRCHNNKKLNQMLQMWWHEIENESTRDQLSFEYSCWKTNFRYDLCNFSIYNNPYFSVESHNC
jgi:hypothetical protein